MAFKSSALMRTELRRAARFGSAARRLRSAHGLRVQPCAESPTLPRLLLEVQSLRAPPGCVRRDKWLSAPAGVRQAGAAWHASVQCQPDPHTDRVSVCSALRQRAAHAALTCTQSLSTHLAGCTRRSRLQHARARPLLLARNESVQHRCFLAALSARRVSSFAQCAAWRQAARGAGRTWAARLRPVSLQRASAADAGRGKMAE